MQAFLTPVPDDVQRSLSRVLPESVQAEIGLDDGEPGYENSPTCLSRSGSNSPRTSTRSRSAGLQAVNDRKGFLVDRYEKTINTLTKRNLLNFLANRNVLPKYGFPDRYRRAQDPVCR